MGSLLALAAAEMHSRMVRIPGFDASFAKALGVACGEARIFTGARALILKFRIRGAGKHMREVAWLLEDLLSVPSYREKGISA